jgi:hypothetical protein
MKTITIDQFLTESELRLAVRLKDRIKVRDQILIPNMARINRVLGQENDADYLAFCVAYVMVKAGEWPML